MDRVARGDKVPDWVGEVQGEGEREGEMVEVVVEDWEVVGEEVREVEGQEEEVAVLKASVEVGVV